MSGVDFIIQVRSEADFAKLPIIVFSNTYLTNLIQEAWKAGANKCLSKTNCTPKDVLDIVRQTIGDEAVPQRATTTNAGKPGKPAASAIARFQRHRGRHKIPVGTADRPSLTASPPRWPRCAPVCKTSSRQTTKPTNSRTSTSSTAAPMRSPATPACRFHARVAHVRRRGGLLKELYEKPKSINTSTLRTVAAGRGFSRPLFERGKRPDNPDPPPVNILVVDDEPISQRAVIYALEKAQLPSTSTADPNAALKLLTGKTVRPRFPGRGHAGHDRL